MPFFQADRKINDTRNSIPFYMKSKFAPLQVRNRNNTYTETNKAVPSREKRALSWASRRIQGSLTLEAALCLPLLLFACVCLMLPMKMMDRQRQIQAVMESVGEEMSQYAYLEDCLQTGNGELVDSGRTDGEEVTGLLGAGYAAMRILGQIDREWIENVSFEGTSIGPDDMIRITMQYRMRLPFSVLGLDSIPVRQVCSRRMWTGSVGGRNGEENGSGEEAEEIVYIGKNSTRYHRQRTCHYLYNDLRAVPFHDVDSLRNQAGAKYGPCKTCGAGPHSQTVYVMPYGTSYHASKTCASITAYVQAVPLSQVTYLGECSYCGGK